MAEHRQDFERELEAIEARIIELFAIVAEDLPEATKALLTGNNEIMQRLTDRDKAISAPYPETEQLANRAILLQARVADDLRAYAYWYFKLYGHDKVLLLDGGRKKWELDSRELSTDVPQRPRTSYTASEQDASLRALRDEVIDAIGKRNLVDVRSPDEFTGRLLAPAHLPQESAQRAGHIPTARNVPWSKAANEDGTFRSDDQLRQLYQGDAGLDFGKDTIAYCRIGERSAHTWFVLHELLGLPNVKNYDGSWTEYGSLVGVPIELGEAR